MVDAAPLPRRTIAIISHPDAGKSTLTEALALHADAISEAGAVHGKGHRRATVSDWMEMEKARGISISSAALQFEYRGHLINLVDTPGHADFSEDTYRVLSAVDSAVMLVDAARGLEPQTLKLFQVCAQRGLPVLTVINKWDRPGLDALELLDEIEREIGLTPTPLTWPVGIAGVFEGVLDRRSGELVRYTRTAGGATRAPEEHVRPEDARAHLRDHAGPMAAEAWDEAAEADALLRADGADHDLDSYLAAVTTPVLFASALLNFAVAQLLDTLVDLAPAPQPTPDVDGRLRATDADFSALVFKVQSGMDAAHRDRLAYARICSGTFERGMSVTHAATKRAFSTKYAQVVFGRERTSVERAYPGDIIGLVNARSLRVGDTIYTGQPVSYPPIATFAPEHFATATVTDASRWKQFRRGIEQLDQEGVVQVLRSEARGDHAPVLAAVGPMQFEVAAARMSDEYGAPVRLESLAYTVARRVPADQVDAVAGLRDVEVLHRADGSALALFMDRWRLQSVQRQHPELILEALPAGADAG
ncbi:peptide chain release factor 3 [Nocardioides mangrovicus]|uniref:Peptide chain release factor 3 n=1 Tax=Nocardioides mangrovicus TaxID=2478913 RepID=A0A3L8P6L0_9ACTN|nr:peptide chain release factor 3 [Nocardioides mangrovicus]RLV50343.1 peptide chain release factor 3 [Nocardioides mangrovicus]